ncbi:hypothetical protein ACFFQW_13635 [Umezawaea endophytica]|uniref:Uncharacterized protein n=1 Tax=Umezawaea endophytica TaxID=1654476 RepID=A0A9X2VLH3_9PSEU|nr:hypothetical protein [Umezawaea endophytica]MCS7478624.1 hypothetical protein [Umezawaea endophytica]
MTTSSRRVVLLLLAVVAASVGCWAYFAPVHWYDTFPGFGHRWLPVLGPYSEHLVKDVGAAYLGLTALSLAAAWRAADTYVVRIAGAGWTVFNVLHLAYHLQHLGMYQPVDQVLNVVALVSIAIGGAVLLLPARANRRAEAPASR